MLHQIIEFSKCFGQSFFSCMLALVPYVDWNMQKLPVEAQLVPVTLLHPLSPKIPFYLAPGLPGTSVPEWYTDKVSRCIYICTVD